LPVRPAPPLSLPLLVLVPEGVELVAAEVLVGDEVVWVEVGVLVLVVDVVEEVVDGVEEVLDDVAELDDWQSRAAYCATTPAPCRRLFTSLPLTPVPVRLLTAFLNPLAALSAALHWPAPTAAET
jgi:hypothetical protein